MDPLQVTGGVAGAAVKFAINQAKSVGVAAALAGAYTTSATHVIDLCGQRHGASSTVWREVTSALADNEVAGHLVRDGSLSGYSVDAQEYLREFLAELRQMLGELVPLNERAAAETILSAIAETRAGLHSRFDTLEHQVGTLNPTDADAGTPWFRQPGAPRLQIRPGLEHRDGPLLYGTVAITSEPTVVPRLSVGMGESDVREAKLMLENSSRPPMMKYQFKPVEIRIEGDTGVVVAVLGFAWKGERRAVWRWPLWRHEKGHFVLDAHLGTPLDEPEWG